MSRYREWTPREIDVVKRMIAQRKTRSEIADALGRSYSSTQRRIRKLGLMAAPAGVVWTDAMDAAVLERFLSETAGAIAKDLGLTPGDVYRRAYRLGLRKEAGAVERLRDLGERVQTAPARRREAPTPRDDDGWVYVPVMRRRRTAAHFDFSQRRRA